MSFRKIQPGWELNLQLLDRDSRGSDYLYLTHINNSLFTKRPGPLSKQQMVIPVKICLAQQKMYYWHWKKSNGNELGNNTYNLSPHVVHSICIKAKNRTCHFNFEKRERKTQCF